MRNQFNIRKFYTPIQPTVQQSEDFVSYKEVIADISLQPYIYCYWELKTNHPLTDQFYYKVVADGCMDIFFDLNDPEESYVMGFCNRYTEFELENTFHYIGIRFLPTMFPALFKMNASELSNRFEHLAFVIPNLAKLIQKEFSPVLTFNQIIATLDLYFKKYLSSANIEVDHRILHAMEIIFNHSGLINVEKDLDVGLSSRQLRRLFEFYIGDTQKTFCQVVRFQQVLIARSSAENLKFNKSFLQDGYYDQAHFIKNFKNLYGLTPHQALQK